ncbi:P-loop NTPase fold protein [Desulfobacterales bacterium HSG16]|nr:P-loop NTPase fold protein [Desulfobacterales bacterium HSG16]
MDSRYANDHWILEDDMGMARTGDLLARMSLEVNTPFSVRVTGKWGSGKTSVLRRAFVTLKGQPVEQAVLLGEPKQEAGSDKWKNFHFDADDRQPVLDWESEISSRAEQSLCVWYSPWQHQQADNPLIPLLLEIKAQFSTRIKIGEKLNRSAGLATMTLLERAIDGAATLMFQKNMKLVQGTTDAVRKSWKESNPDLTKLSDGQRFQLLFEDAVENALKSLPENKKDDFKNSRLIIFIDDLDRCEESIIINLLESIKLYLGSPHCVFVLGMDDTAILGALKRFWEGRSEDENREYLEKMFQATVAVPLPKHKGIRGFLEKQLCLHEFMEPKNCAVIIEELLEPNPRKIKNFLNSLCAAWNQFNFKERAKDSDDVYRFIMFQYIRLYHRPVWRILERQPKALMILRQVLVGVPDEQLPEDVAFEEDLQGVLKELFTRIFIHVVKDDEKNPEDQKLYHRSIPIDQAVTLFEERLDRKRSDEVIVRLFKKFIPKNMALADIYLYLS